MVQGFRIRVVSENERLSALFSMYLIKRIDFKIIPALIASHDYLNSDVEFSDIRRWSWLNAIEKLSRFIKKNINTIIISDQFLDWSTDKELINEDLDRLEDFLSENQINVFNIESFSSSQINKIKSRFQETDTWSNFSVDTVMDIMISDYKHGSLAHPYGVLPYFMLDPLIKNISDLERGMRAFVGFQPWTCENKEELNDMQSQYKHVGMIKGFKQTAPVPIFITL